MALLRLPLLSLILGLIAIAMLVPSVYAALMSDWRIARAFLYSAIFIAVAAGSATLLMSGRREPSARRELSVLLFCWVAVPAFAAIPVAMLFPALGPFGAWVEMTLSFTTTGGSAFGDLKSVPAPVHLWRGIVGWCGGLVTLVAAYVLLAPRQLGGFEIESAGSRGRGDAQSGRSVVLQGQTTPVEERLYRALRVVLPIYAGLTGILTITFTLFGQNGLNSAVHAMSILSTSGISPNELGIAAEGSLMAEVAAAVFMIAASTRLLYNQASQSGRSRSWRSDPELQLLGWMVGLATVLLFSRHWIGALTIEVSDVSLDAFTALWGSFFTTLSFLTTTGFESTYWQTARDWSGLANPGLLLLGLCAVGGGAATTAGGIKLIRTYALIRHGVREVERIACPESIMGVGADLRSMMRAGAVIAWTFIMLYFLALMLTILGLAATGLSFEESLISATAAISNTGPILTVLTDGNLRISDLDRVAQVILCAAAIAGRIEVLALIAIFNLDVWQQRLAATKNHW